MKINKDRVKLCWGTFKHSALSQLEQPDTWAIGLVCGIFQGLKYKGNLSKGILTGAVVTGGIAVTNGIMNVFTFRKNIKDATLKD